jgi:hypothetical protein
MQRRLDRLGRVVCEQAGSEHFRSVSRKGFSVANHELPRISSSVYRASGFGLSIPRIRVKRGSLNEFQGANWRNVGKDS